MSKENLNPITGDEYDTENQDEIAQSMNDYQNSIDECIESLNHQDTVEGRRK